MNLELKTNSPVVLVKVYDDEDDFCTSRFAVVTFTKELIDRISELRKTRETCKAYEISDWSTACQYASEYEQDDENISEEQIETLEDFTRDNKGSWQIAPVEEFAKILQEGSCVYVSEFGVKFDCMIKHSNTRIYTEKISWEEIDGMVL